MVSLLRKVRVLDTSFDVLEGELEPVRASLDEELNWTFRFLAVA